MEKNIKNTLEMVRHEFSCLTGLGAFDKMCPEQTWELNYTEIIKKIDDLLIRFDDRGSYS